MMIEIYISRILVQQLKLLYLILIYMYLILIRLEYVTWYVSGKK